MSKMSFLHDRAEKENTRIMNVVRKAVVDGSVQIGLIKDDDLAMIPESVGALSQLAHVLREDLFSYHNIIKKSLQFPLIRNQFTYAFAKGAESAFLWNESSNGQFDFNYDMKDSLLGNAGAQVSHEFSNVISAGMILASDVFVDFQDALIDKKNKFVIGDGELLADVIASGYFWASQIGIDYGLKNLGMN